MCCEGLPKGRSPRRANKLKQLASQESAYRLRFAGGGRRCMFVWMRRGCVDFGLDEGGFVRLGGKMVRQADSGMDWAGLAPRQLKNAIARATD
jgi:hypothetical protein